MALNLVPPGMQSEEDKQKAQAAGATPVVLNQQQGGSTSAGAMQAGQQQQQVAKQAQKGSGVGPNISRVLAANDPSRGAKAITGSVGGQANKVAQGIEQAKNKFEAGRQQQQATVDKAYNTAQAELQGAGNAGSQASDQGTSIADATYAGPTQLSLDSNIGANLDAVQNAAAASRSAGGLQQLAQSQFASQGRPYSKGSSALDAMLLGIGGAKELRAIGRQAAQTGQLAQQETKSAEALAGATALNIDNQKAAIEKKLLESMSQYGKNVDSRKQALLDKINAGTASSADLASAGINLAPGEAAEITPELLASIKSGSLAKAGEFDLLGKYADKFKRSGEASNLLKNLGVGSKEELGKANLETQAAFKTGADAYKKVVSDANATAEQQFAGEKANQDRWSQKVAGINLFDPNTNAADPNLQPTTEALVGLAQETNKPELVSSLRAAEDGAKRSLAKAQGAFMGGLNSYKQELQQKMNTELSAVDGGYITGIDGRPEIGFDGTPKRRPKATEAEIQAIKAKYSDLSTPDEVIAKRWQDDAKNAMATYANTVKGSKAAIEQDLRNNESRIISEKAAVIRKQIGDRKLIRG